MKCAALPFAFVLFLSACATTTDQGAIGVERKQFLLVPSGEIVNASEQAYNQTKTEAQQKGLLDKNPQEVQRVRAVSQRLIPQTAIFRKDAPSWNWEVHVITSPELNAYCMPGGKIMFYSSLIEKLQLTDAEIAAVMGHEISHALREHGRERMSQQLAEQLGLEVLMASGKLDQKYAGVAAGLTTIFISLPYSRHQESEADEMGLELMARAGYNPQEALNLWRKMATQGGAKPPQLLSDHPADATRLADLQSLLPKVMPLYESSRH